MARCEGGNFGRDRLRKQRSRTVEQDFGQRAPQSMGHHAEIALDSRCLKPTALQSHNPLLRFH